MGQKVNPVGFRINNGNRREWASNWFTKKKEDYVNSVIGDLKIQDYFLKNSSKYSSGTINIERQNKKPVKVSIFSGKISLVIGKRGENIEKIEKDLKKELGVDSVSVDVKELKHPNLNANIIARNIADRIENRQSFKRSVKTAIENVMKSGAVGIKVSCAGRLNGAEIARTETFKEGVTPLHTLRADIDYACHNAVTTYGIIGVRVWICSRR